MKMATCHPDQKHQAHGLCHKCYNQRWFQKNKLEIKTRKFGISGQEFNCLMKSQDSLCAICKLPETGRQHYGGKSLAVDHCHTTKRVRGLLCENCNRGVGMFGDDPKLMRLAADYIENSTKQENIAHLQLDEGQCDTK